MRDPLRSRDAQLRATAAELHREWRADEEEWSRAALEHFRHGRSLVDVLRDVMHRGDVVVLADDPALARGVLVHVGDDWCRLAAVGGAVEVPVSASSPVVRVVERARCGGRLRDPDSPARWRGRLLELEIAGVACVVELRSDEASRGRLLVGGDHVVVVDGAEETYVPFDALARLRVPTRPSPAT
jgi:hypothetical protein